MKIPIKGKYYTVQKRYDAWEMIITIDEETYSKMLSLPKCDKLDTEIFIVDKPQARIFKHKQTQYIAIQRDEHSYHFLQCANANDEAVIMPKKLIENTNDWVELDKNFTLKI
jgi:hypothetical protein